MNRYIRKCDIMNYARNEKYFGQKPSSIPTLISALMIGVGILLLLLSFTRGFHYAFYALAFLLTVGGVVIWAVFSNIKIKDSEIDDELVKIREGFASDFDERFGQKNAARIKFEQTYGPKSTSVREEKYEPVFFDTYWFEGDGTLRRDGSDGRARSSVYSSSGYVLKKDRICIGRRLSSLISPDRPEEDFFAEYAYSELTGAAIEAGEKVGRTGTAVYGHLMITAADGTVVSLPVIADAAADEHAARILNRIISAARNRQ